MYELGILGGMGPKATHAAFGRIIEYTSAASDQEHLNIIVLNHSSVPDRTGDILNGENRITGILDKDLEILKQLGVGVALAACNTAHYFIRQAEIPSGVVFIDSVNETLGYIKATYGKRRYCVLCTDGTLLSGVYGDSASGAVYPETEHQNTLMEMIGAVKSGTEPAVLLPVLAGVMDDLLRLRGDMVFVLACTEISLFRDLLKGKYTCVDCMDVALTRAILQCGYRINQNPARYLENIEYFHSRN
jgi:aspartate racemase